MNICVFCSSSDAVSPAYNEVAEALGAALAGRGHVLVYGGASVGTMGILARSMQQRGGRVIGVLPEPLRTVELAYEAADELVITRDLRERKAVMQQRSDAFLALPGGWGTLEEMVEMLTLKQLDLHRKAMVWLNAEGFWAPLVHLFEHMMRERFVKPEYVALYHVARDIPSALDYLETYEWADTGSKWWGRSGLKATDA